MRTRTPELVLALGVLLSQLLHAPGGEAASRGGPPAPPHPRRAESYWAGLGRAAESATASAGVISLRAPFGGRVRLEGGSFFMGASDLDRVMDLCRKEVRGTELTCERLAQEFRDELPRHEVFLSPFSIDQREVRVDEYARCVSAGACTAPRFTPGDGRYDRPDLPVTNVAWDDAAAYCAWAGGRLPTEAEWEFAARGTAGRDFPWGDVYNPSLCNHGSVANDETNADDGFVGLAPVGSFPDGATPDGILDLAGNAAEWVSDYYERPTEPGAGYPSGSQVNPTGPSSGALHVVRGGSFVNGAIWMRAAWRGSTELVSSYDIGFRCAGKGAS